MRVPVTLGLYGLGLVAVFAVSFVVAGAVIPDSAAADWTTVEHPTEDH